MKRPAPAFLLAAFVLAALAGCTLEPTHTGATRDDGPGGPLPSDPDRIADARPRSEPLNRGANNGRKFHGKPTSSGERYDMYAMTAAHTLLPIPSYARVTNLSNGRSVVVRVNDRGPFHAERIIDLSYAAAYKLGFVDAGSVQVEVEAILPRSSPAARARPALEPIAAVR